MAKNENLERCQNAGWLEEVCSVCGKVLSKTAVLDGTVPKGKTVQQSVMPFMCSCGG